MKRKFIPLLALAVTLLTPATVSAQSTPQESDLLSFFNLVERSNPLIVVDAPPEKPVEVEPVVYVVVDGDSLIKIGTEYGVEWQRLWAKNTQLEHPDLLDVGDKITVPEPTEQLEREIPAAVALPAVTPGVQPQISSNKASVSAAPVRFDGSNTYGYGYCTWYVKNLRGASLPNGLGNANTWYSRARAMGMAVGSTPRAGAVGTTTRGSLGHVVYVKSVNSDGTVNISDMNYRAWNVVTHRTVNASEFLYIY